MVIANYNQARRLSIHQKFRFQLLKSEIKIILQLIHKSANFAFINKKIKGRLLI